MECDESFDDFVAQKCVPRRKPVVRQRPSKKKKCTSDNKIKTNYISSSAPECSTNPFSYNGESQSVNEETPICFKTVSDKENSTSNNVISHSVSDILLKPIEQNILLEDSGIPQDVLYHSQSSSIDFMENSSKQQCSTEIEDRNWLCIFCGNKVPLQCKDIHFQNCIHTYGHVQENTKGLSNEPLTLPLTCNICDINITHLSLEDRCEHVNKCLDSKINTTGSSTERQPITVVITECPLCLKNCNTTQNRLIHIKKCSKTKGISLQNVIVALQMQQKHTFERMALGLPLPKANIPEKKIIERMPKKMSEPKSQADADIQLAKALSLSFQEEEKRKDLLTLGDTSLNEIFMSKLLKPPTVQDKPGKKKKKNVNKPIPTLLLRTEEERQKLFEDRISNILAAPHFMEGVTSDKAFIPEKCPLWSLSGAAEEKMFYYVQDLMDYVTPDDIQAGSKLQDLSQVPGHQIYTQQACDYSFGYSQKNEDEEITAGPVKASQTSSTQEIVNIMAVMEQETSVCNKTNLSQRDIDPTQGKDGFFCEFQSHEGKLENPMIKLLGTLVDSEWLSDVNIIVSGGSVISAHSLLLQLRCPGLRQILKISKNG